MRISDWSSDVCSSDLVQRRALTKVLAIRIGAPASRGIPPFSGWPRDVRDAVFGDSALIRGGFNFDGQAIADFDAAAVADVARRRSDERRVGKECGRKCRARWLPY